MALAPLVRGLSRVIPRGIAAAIVVIAIAGAFGFTAWMLSDQVAAFSRRLPSILREVRSAVQSASPRQSLIRQVQQAVTELEQTAVPAKLANATPVTIVESVDVQRQSRGVAEQRQRAARRPTLVRLRQDSGRDGACPLQSQRWESANGRHVHTYKRESADVPFAGAQRRRW